MNIEVKGKISERWIVAFVNFKKGIQVTKGIAKKTIWDFKGQDRAGKNVTPTWKQSIENRNQTLAVKALTNGSKPQVKLENQRVISCNIN